MCLKSRTYFYFFIRTRQCLFLPSHGSSLISLPFPPSCCFRSCDVCSDVVRGDVSSILLPTMRSKIFGSLSSLDFVTDGRNSIVATTA